MFANSVSLSIVACFELFGFFSDLLEFLEMEMLGVFTLFFPPAIHTNDEYSKVKLKKT